MSEVDSPDILKIYLLGHLRVVAGRHSIEESDWPRSKAKSLIALLALKQPHSLHREQLMEALYPDLEPALAASNIHRMVHLARQTLEPSLHSGSKSRFLKVAKQQVSLDAPGGVFTDLEEFERAAAMAFKSRRVTDCERAIALYGGDLLTADPYEDWAAARREQTSVLFNEILSLAGESYEFAGRSADAIECYRKLTTRNPTDEEAHRQLMRLYALAGNNGQATRQYKLCVEAIAREFGDKPERPTVELYRQIISGEVSVSGAHIKRTVAAPARNVSSRREPVFNQLSFRRGTIREARCTPDGSLVVCSAGFGGSPAAVYAIHTGTKHWRSLGIEDAMVLAVSKQGEIAVGLRRQFVRGFVTAGTLMRLYADGRMANELLEGVQWADFAPDGKEIAVVRDVGGRNRVEYPLGRVLYESGGWISHARFSPQGDLLAFLDHAVRADDRGRVIVQPVVGGEPRVIASELMSVQGLAWSSCGEEVWYTAAETGTARALWASPLNGERRFIYRGAGSLTLHDALKDGRLLLSRDDTRLEIFGRAPGSDREIELSWLDWSLARDLSDDGEQMLFTEAGEGDGETYGVYLRATDGSPPVRLGDGSALALSPDGEWALAVRQKPERRLVLLPTRGGGAKLLARAALNYQPWGGWFPDGRRIFFAANEPERGTRLFLQDIEGNAPVCLTPEEEGVELTSTHALSPDSKRIAAVRHNGEVCLYPTSGGLYVPAKGIEPGEVPARWGDENTLYVFRRGASKARIFRVNLRDGTRELWKQLSPADPTGVHEILRVLMTHDKNTYVYTCTRNLSNLFIAEGLI